MATAATPSTMGCVTLALRARELRERAGYSYGDLARRTGLSRTYLYHLEAGMRSTPTLAALQDIADAYDITVSDLVAGVRVG